MSQYDPWMRKLMREYLWDPPIQKHAEKAMWNYPWPAPNQWLSSGLHLGPPKWPPENLPPNIPGLPTFPWAPCWPDMWPDEDPPPTLPDDCRAQFAPQWPPEWPPPYFPEDYPSLHAPSKWDWPPKFPPPVLPWVQMPDEENFTMPLMDLHEYLSRKSFYHKHNFTSHALEKNLTLMKVNGTAKYFLWGSRGPVSWWDSSDVRQLRNILRF